MKACFLFVFILLASLSFCQVPAVIPEPVSMVQREGKFVIDKSTVIEIMDSGDKLAADFFNHYLQQYYGFILKTTNKKQQKGIRLYTRKFIKAPDADGYHLESSSSNIAIEGDTYAGTFYGIQTLIQLLPVTRQDKLSIPALTIDDAPRFAYRGMMLDVCRHFFPVSFVKQYIDFLALHKLNRFHWHLTDDQGWRIEIKKYPKLTQVGGWRNGTIIGRYPGKGNDNKRYGGYYTQDEIRDVVAYAKQRYIEIIPEIEMPGHASAAIAAYPELSCFPQEPTVNYFRNAGTWAGDSTGKQVIQSWGVYDDVFVPSDNTFTFLQNVLDEVISLFPGKYIHIGGDECPKTNWKRSAFCQQLIKEKNLGDEHGLQSYFIQRMEKYLNGKGRMIIGWDEILEGGLAPNAAVMSWRGEAGGIAAARQKHEAVMTPGGWLYIDHAQHQPEDSLTIGGFTPLMKTYSYEPVSDSLTAAEAKYIKGTQGNLWTEYIAYPSKVEYQVFPRMAALSEVAWSPKNKKDPAKFLVKMKDQEKRYDLWKVKHGKVSAVMPAPR